MASNKDFIVKNGIQTGGPVTLPGNPVSALQAAPKQYVDTVSPAINPTTPKDGDVKVASGVVSIYATGSWRQIFPAVYA